MLKYEDNLWGKTDFLHNQYKLNTAYYKDILDFIEKIKKACITFSETINEIFNKKTNLVEDQSNSFYSLFQSFQNLMKNQSEEFKKLGELINRDIIEPYKKMSHTIDKTEETLCKELNDLNRALKKAKLKLEENRNIYFNKMKETEKLIIAEKSAKPTVTNIILSNNQEPKEQKNPSYNSIVDCIKEEEKYNKSLEEVNKLIESTNFKEKQLLNFYQAVEEKNLNEIKDYFSLLLTNTIGTYSTIITEVNSISHKFINIKNVDAINAFIEKNKSISKPMDPVQFVPYVPISSLQDSLQYSTENDQMNISYEVIAYLQKFFTGICSNVDMEEEKRRKNFRVLCFQLFDKDPSPLTKEDLDTMVELIKGEEYMKYFLSALTCQRLNGQYKREEKLFNELVIILDTILEVAGNGKKFDIIKNCIILSQTFYLEINVGKDEEDDELVQWIYLMEKVKNHKFFTDPSFWKEFIEYNVLVEKSKFENSTKSDDPSYIHNIYFSVLITYTNNMHMFGLSKNDVISVSDYIINKYGIVDNLKNVIVSDIERLFNEKNAGKKNVKKNSVKLKLKNEKKKIEEEWVVDESEYNIAKNENEKTKEENE